MFTGLQGLASTLPRSVKVPALAGSLGLSAFLTGSQGEGPQLHWLTRLLGYGCTAFLVASANASLVGSVRRVRLNLSPNRSLAGSPKVGAWSAWQVVRAIQSWTLRQANPRAAPKEFTGINRNEFRSAPALKHRTETD